MMEYGLIGEKLGHSFSKIIHEKLADYTYELCPLAKDELDAFMKAKQFKAINVPFHINKTSFRIVMCWTIQQKESGLSIPL